MHHFAIRSAILATAACLCAMEGNAQPPQASVTITGQACTTPEGTPNLTVNGTPRLNSRVQVVYRGPNHEFNNTQSIAHPHLVVGFAPLGPISIPQSLFFNQPAGCTLNTTQDIVLPMASNLRNPGVFVDNVTIPISNDQALLGLTFFTQWIVPHTQCGFAGCGPGFSWVGTSETAAISIGV